MLVAELQELEEVKNADHQGPAARRAHLRRDRHRGVRGRRSTSPTSRSSTATSRSPASSWSRTSTRRRRPPPRPSAPTASAAGAGAKTALDLKPDMTTDSLQLFLKDIGKVRLLTAAGGGRARQADRARRPRRQAEDGRVEPAPGRLDRQELPQPGPALPRPDPGGHARAWSARPRSSTTARASSSRPTRPGGSARRSPARSPTRRGRSASRSTWSRS